MNDKRCFDCIHFRHSSGGPWGYMGADPPYTECRALERADADEEAAIAEAFESGFANGCPKYRAKDDRNGEW